jgi:hypothetical protein
LVQAFLKKGWIESDLRALNLPLPKGESQFANLRRTDNTKKKISTKEQTTIYKTYILIYRSGNTNPTKNWG